MATSESLVAFQEDFEARLFSDKVLCVLAICGILLSNTRMLYSISKTALTTGFTTSLAILSSLTIADLLLALNLSIQAMVLFGSDVQMSCAIWYLSGAFSVFVHPFVSSLSLVVLSMVLMTSSGSRGVLTSCGNTFFNSCIYCVTPWCLGLVVAWPLSVLGTEWRFCTNNFTTERQAAQIMFCILLPVSLAVICSIMVKNMDLTPRDNSALSERMQEEEKDYCEKPNCYKTSRGENVSLRLSAPAPTKCQFESSSQPNHFCLDDLLCCCEKKSNDFAKRAFSLVQYPTLKRTQDSSLNALNLHTDQCRLAQYRQQPHDVGQSHHNLQLHHRQEETGREQHFFNCPQCLCPRQTMTRHSHYKYMTSQRRITTVAINRIKHILPSVSLIHLVCTLPFALMYLIKLSDVIANTESFSYIITNQLCMWLMYLRNCLTATVWFRSLSTK